MPWNLINTVMASIGIGLAIWGITYRRRQFELLKQQDANAKKQATEDEAKFGLAAKNLIKMSRNYVNIGASQGFAYHFLFPTQNSVIASNPFSFSVSKLWIYKSARCRLTG